MLDWSEPGFASLCPADPLSTSRTLASDSPKLQMEREEKVGACKKFWVFVGFSLTSSQNFCLHLTTVLCCLSQTILLLCVLVCVPVSSLPLLIISLPFLPRNLQQGMNRIWLLFLTEKYVPDLSTDRIHRSLSSAQFTSGCGNQHWGQKGQLSLTVSAKYYTQVVNSHSQVHI